MEEEPRFTLPLKNGALADVRDALVDLNYLRAELALNPEGFQILLDLAHARPPTTATSERIELLKKHGHLSRDGTLPATIRDILLSAHQVTPEGPVLVSPFKLESATDRLLVERAERQIQDVHRRLARGSDEDGPSLG